ncbi:MAG: hypothetical protein KDI43_15630 [Gammaproteobacteria bacterium]|nr:hypothetical protein [Gammaproteobacteria bacterium]
MPKKKRFELPGMPQHIVQQVARMECNEIRGEDDNSSRISLCYIRATKLLATPDREYALSSMMQSAPDQSSK